MSRNWFSLRALMPRQIGGRETWIYSVAEGVEEEWRLHLQIRYGSMIWMSERQYYYCYWNTLIAMRSMPECIDAESSVKFFGPIFGRRKLFSVIFLRGKAKTRCHHWHRWHRWFRWWLCCRWIKCEMRWVLEPSTKKNKILCSQSISGELNSNSNSLWIWSPS